ncbi:Ig-like domain-containing protein [Carboxylicivirga sp. M1479]|uniref:Ig-like domain-containing protein n=1 Tax=Carboxylicivirga sp. M1479 TaxID=2594476 RepID=UPI001178760D|nr:Ig-like domain-containing protein [Carboxylicivirga sp. M1479]TRX65688.1 hypothetical protein FNN09_17295 [Carboxylicivirga sp. M1479]
MKNIYALVGLLVLLSFSNVGWGQSIITNAATNITANGATLNATASGLDVGKTYYVEYYYGPAGDLLQNNIKSDDVSGVTTANFPLLTDVELSSNTEYFFTAYLFEDTDTPPFYNYIGSGSEMSFTTEVVLTGISTNAATNITINGATLNATASGLDVGKSYYVEYYYGPAGDLLQNYIKSNNISGVTTADFPLITDAELFSNTEYFFTAYLYEAIATPPFGNYIGGGGELSFITASPLSVTLYNPLQDDSNVTINPLLQLTFNQDVEFIDPLAEYKILLRQGGATIDEFIVSPGFKDGNLVFDGNLMVSDRLNITPYSTLAVGTEYHVIIPSGLVKSFVSEETFTGITSSTGWRFTTVANPVWANGYPLTRNVSPISVEFVGQVDKIGTCYYVVTDNNTEPTIAQIKAGQDATGSPASYASGSVAIETASAEFNDAIDVSDHELYDAETTYYVYAVTTDDVNSLDSEIGITSFTTLERIAPITSFDPIDGANDVSILAKVVITFDEPVRMTNGTIIDDTNVASLILFNLNPANPVDFTASIDDEKQVITITPNVPLNENSGYDITILAVEDYFDNEQLSSSKASFNTTNVVVWNGNQSSVWTVNQNWDGNFNPGSSVHIPYADGGVPITNMPIISTDITVGHISIESGASLEIENTGSLIINETLTMGSSTTGAGNASIIDNGSTSINVDPSKVSIQQAIMSSTRGYHLSSPVVGATKSNMGVDNAIYVFDNPTDSWPKLGDNDVLSIGRGYGLYTSVDIEFKGALNQSSSYSVPLTRTDGEGYGWNLVGNPYTAAIDWNQIALGHKVNINNAYWVFLNDPSNYGLYATYSSGGGGTNGLDNLIPTHQAYYVKVNLGETIGSLTMPKSALSPNNKSILKSAPVEFTRVKLAGVNGDYIDETILSFTEDAEDYIDMYDAEKRFTNYKNYLELFFYEESNSFAIDCKKSIYDGLIVPIGYKVSNTGAYSIRRQSIDNILDDYEVYLEDKYLDGQFINLREQSEYNFESDKIGKIVDRFALHFSSVGVVTGIDGNENKLINIYAHDSSIYINGDNLIKQLYEVYTIDGKRVKQGYLMNNGLNTINLREKGLFIVRVTIGSMLITEKVLLR